MSFSFTNNLLKFIDLRTHDGAQWEIQQVAKACLDNICSYLEIVPCYGKSPSCGNEICEFGESYLECAADCPDCNATPSIRVLNKAFALS